MKHTGTVTFETERLICRRFLPGDLADVHSWAGDPQIQTEYGEPVYSSIEEARNLLEKYINSYSNHAVYRWAIIEKQSRRNIGQIALCKVYPDCATGEIEYCISRQFWGKGYAGESLAGLIAHLFSNSDFEKLEAFHRAENHKSGRVLQKSPMHITENVERFKRLGKTAAGEVCYCITAEDFKRANICKKN